MKLSRIRRPSDFFFAVVVIPAVAFMALYVATLWSPAPMSGEEQIAQYDRLVRTIDGLEQEGRTVAAIYGIEIPLPCPGWAQGLVEPFVAPNPAATNIIDVQLTSLRRRLNELTPSYQQARQAERAAEERRQEQARQAEAETIRKVQKRCAKLRAKRLDELTVGDYDDLGSCGLRAPAMR